MQSHAVALPLAADEFWNPLDEIRSEHKRQVSTCERLVDFANARDFETVISESEALFDFFATTLPLHSEDEEDLFPLLKIRCRSEDGIGVILEQFEREHRVDEFLARHAIIDLRNICEGRIPADAFPVFSDVRTFAQVQLRHIFWENEVVLPLARKRLMPEDLQEMGQKMAARRESR